MNEENKGRKELQFICQQAYKEVQLNTGYRKSKAFFNSQAYTFIQQLIHLHSPQLNLQLKTILKTCIRTDATQQPIDIQTILKDMKQVKQQKNLHEYQELQEKVMRLFRYLMGQQCKAKNDLELQNIELELQCSLNYTCPTCIKDQQRQNIHSMKELDCERETEQESGTKMPWTMRLIEEESRNRENDLQRESKSKIDSIIDEMRKERQKKSQLRRCHKKQLSKYWSNIGKLMCLQKQHFYDQNDYQSAEQAKRQLLKAMNKRNTNNRRMINDFCDKVKRISKIKLSRSVSIKIKEKQLDENKQPATKLWSLRDVQNNSRRVTNRRTTHEKIQSYVPSPTTQFNFPTCARIQARTQKIQTGFYSNQNQGWQHQIFFSRKKGISICKLS